MRTALLIAAAMGCLTATASAMPGTPMVGGPCSYEFKDTVATVDRVLEGEAELTDADGVTFYKRLDEFDPAPQPGDRYDVVKRYIVEGSCTPYGFQISGPAAEPASEAGE